MVNTTNKNKESSIIILNDDDDVFTGSYEIVDEDSEDGILKMSLVNTVPNTDAYAPKLAIVSFLKPKNVPSFFTASSA